MIVYYIATEEKPATADGVKFFTDAGSARDASLTTRGSVYQFTVNDKCDTQNFGMDTQMVFIREDDGDLKFMGSGQWVEIHEILNVPFYCDFEQRSSKFVSMSLKYFNENYQVVPRGTIPIKQSEQPQEPLKKRQRKSVQPEEKRDTEQPGGSTNESGDIDQDVLNELFGGASTGTDDLTKMLF